MECPICGFSNIPGTERCTRCRAQLVAAEPAAAADFLPPRAGRLKGLRPLLYAVNRFVEGKKLKALARIGRFFDRAGSVPGEAVGATILSVVPGLGHVAAGRRLGALVAFLGWAVILLLTVNFYAGATGGLLLGSLIGWHAAVIFDAGKLQQHLSTARDRLMTMLFILICTFIPYFALDRLAMSYIEFVVSPFNLEALDIRQGDVLISWRGRHEPGSLRAGDVVVVGQSWAHGYAYYGGTIGVGRVVAVGGDRVTVSPGGIEVNGQPVETSMMPSGTFLFPSSPLSLNVPNDAVFVPRPVSHAFHPTEGMVQSLWKGAYMVRLAAVRGKVSGVYLPLGRRRSLRTS